MSEQQNLEVVQRGYEAFGRGDLEGLIALLDANVSWVTPGPEDMPTAGTRRGHAAVRDFFSTLLGMIEIADFQPQQFLTSGDTVVVLGTDVSKVRATGKTIAFQWVHIFTVRNDRVVAFEERGDVSALAAELRSVQARA